MTAGITAWQQAGKLYVWRYAAPGRSRKGWHFTADLAGCRSMIDLIARMVAASGASHRTLQLGSVTPAIWTVPNFGPPRRDQFGKLRLEYSPERDALSLDVIDGRLTLRLGERRSAALSTAFAEVSVGLGDFGLAPSDDKHADSWMFWWMPRSNEH